MFFIVIFAANKGTRQRRGHVPESFAYAYLAQINGSQPELCAKKYEEHV